MLLGHSYGAYLARGVSAQRPDLVLGLALLWPVGEHSGQVPGTATRWNCLSAIRTPAWQCSNAYAAMDERRAIKAIIEVSDLA